MCMLLLRYLAIGIFSLSFVFSRTTTSNATRYLVSFLYTHSQLSGPSSSLARVQYQIDDISGNEIKEDEDVRNSTTQLVYE